jgi:hypothetical protein
MNIYPPTQKTTPACRNAGHFGVQARPMAVDECEEDNPPKPCA